MPQVIITRSAVEDSKRLITFLNTRSTDAAKHFAAKLLECRDLLETQPSAGRPDELTRGLRVIRLPVYGGYSLTYRYNDGDEQLLILAIKHDKELGQTS